MSQDREVFVILADEDAVSKIKDAVATHAGDRLRAKKVQAQVGDPNMWTLIAEVSKVALPALIPALVTLLGHRKLKKVKVGDVECEDVTLAEFARILEANRPPSSAPGNNTPTQ